MLSSRVFFPCGHTPKGLRPLNPDRKIRTLRICLLAGLVALGCSEPGPRLESPARPNVALIVLDTTRADILSAYGYPKATSPSLEAIAAEGVTFHQAITTDFWTLPAHASILTGQYPTTHQATAETNRLPERANTLAEYLGNAGYRTRAYVSNPWIGASRGFAQGFESYIETWKSGSGIGEDFAIDRAGVTGAEEWIDERVTANENFFLFLNLNSAHMPYSPDALTLFDLSPTPRSPARTQKLRTIKGMWAHLGGEYALSDEDFEILEELYAAEVARVDQLVGRLIDFIEARGILDDTLVIITSDHGENLGEHGKVDHLLSMYETTIRVPLIIRHPASFAEGTQSDQLVSLVDLVPTVLEICGFSSDSLENSGLSLLGGKRPPDAFVIAENDRPLNGIELMKNNYPDFDTTQIDRRMRMLRTRSHKLIWYDDGETEVYDLQNDPEELENIADREPELRKQLVARLEAWSESLGEPAPPTTSTPVEMTDPQTQEQLRALGYIE